MKKLVVIFLFVAITLWVKIFAAMYLLEASTLSVIISFVIAPFLEEYIFRFLPLRFGKKWNCQEELMWVSIILFALMHKGNYDHFGLYYCFLIQGVLGFTLWQVMQKTNYVTAVIFHSLYNVMVFTLLG